MTNIFLTGEVGVGKSTVIRKVITLLAPLVCGGFRTVSAMPITENGLLDVFIECAWAPSLRDAAHLVGTRLGHGRFTPNPAIFDTIGASILVSPPAEAALVLMDELGMMENDAELFRQAVMDTLCGSLPVLGVIKTRHTDFLDAIRTHERSMIFEVTEENRDDLPTQIAEQLRPTVQAMRSIEQGG